MKYLWEILVPTTYQDTGKPVSTRHHKEWDKYILRFSSGMTILRPAMGVWLHDERRYDDRMIPVRLTCSRSEIEKIAMFTKKHYRQLAVMAYKISEEVIFI